MSSDATKPSRQDQAAAWFAAERAGVMLIEQRAEFDAWRADPRNQAALDRMRELWEDLAILKGHEPPPKVARPPRRFAKIAAALLILIIGGVGTASLVAASSDTSIITANGQQRTESMPDGSVVAVNVASTVSYKIDDARRIATLTNGEAAFTVRPDPDRPFIVKVGDIEVRAVGTAFNVRQRDGRVQIAVSEGQVELCRAGGAGGASVFATLGAGQLMEVPASLPASFTVPATTNVLPAHVAEWRMRIVSYENATVRDVVGDLNRYFSRQVSINAEAMASRRITIRLRVDDRDQAVETLASLLDARVVRQNRGDEIVE